MNIVVTGGNGFIGRKLVEALVQRGHMVTVLTRNSGPFAYANLTFVHGDLTSHNCPVDQLLNGCDVIFHCAGELRNVAGMEALHVGGTRRLLAAIRKSATSRQRGIHWVQLSSVGAYGFPPEFTNKERIVTEDTAPQPAGDYEITKTKSDELVLQAQELGAFSCSIVRPSKVIGAGMPSNSVRSLCAMVRKGLFFYVGPRGAVATYVHVDDVVDVLVLCGFDERAKGEIYNISNDCLLEEMVSGIAESQRVASPKFRLPEGFVRTVVAGASMMVNVPLSQEQISGLVRRTKYPYEKLERKLGYRPKRWVPDTIAEVIAS